MKNGKSYKLLPWAQDNFIGIYTSFSTYFEYVIANHKTTSCQFVAF